MGRQAGAGARTRNRKATRRAIDRSSDRAGGRAGGLTGLKGDRNELRYGTRARARGLPTAVLHAEAFRNR